jgi:hypothetical protein
METEESNFHHNQGHNQTVTTIGVAFCMRVVGATVVWVVDDI